MPLAAAQAHQSSASTRISRWTKREGERGRHPVHDAAVGFPVPAGDQRCALGQLVFADLAVEHELIQRRLYHGYRRRQLFEIDEPAAGVVRRRKKGRRRPAGAIGAVAPGDAAQVHGVEQERADVDILAVRVGRDLLGDHRFGGSGRSPDHTGLAGLDEERERAGKLARAQRVVGGDGVGMGHGRAPDGGKSAQMPSPDIRPSPRRLLRLRSRRFGGMRPAG